MAGNRALFYAIAGIILMSMVVPLVLNPLPPVADKPEQASEGDLAGLAAFNPDNPSVTCIDHNKIDIYTKSYITFDGVDYVDYCSGSDVVKMICTPGNSGNLEKGPVSYPCIYGCDNGACKLQ